MVNLTLILLGATAVIYLHYKLHFATIQYLCEKYPKLNEAYKK